MGSGWLGGARLQCCWATVVGRDFGYQRLKRAREERDLMRVREEREKNDKLVKQKAIVAV